MTRVWWRVSVMVGIGASAWGLTLAPPGVSLFLGHALECALLVLLLSNWHRLTAITDIVVSSEASRADAVTALELRSDALADVLARVTISQQNELASKIDAGTLASQAALREANAVNKKIADLDQRIIDALPPKPEPSVTTQEYTGRERRRTSHD